MKIIFSLFFLQYSFLSFGFSKKNNNDSLIIYLIKTEKAAKKTKNKKQKCDYYLDLAEVYLNHNFYDKSIKYYLEAKKNRPFKNYEINYIEGNVAYIYSLIGQQKKASYYHKKVLNRVIKNKDTVKIIQTLNNLALIQTENKNIDSANFYYQQLISLIKKTKENKKYAIYYINIAKFYNMKREYNLADIYFQKSFSLINKNTPSKVKGYFHIIYAKHLQSLNKKNEKQIIDYLNKNIQKIDKFSITNQNLLELLFELNKKVNDNEKALHYLELFNEVKDSLKVKEANVNIEKTLLESAYEEKISEEKIKKEKQKKIIIIIIFSLCILILLFVIKHIQLKNKIKENELKNKINTASKKELLAKLELKNKEIVVNSLLSMKMKNVVNDILLQLRDIKSQTDKATQNQLINTVLNQLQKNIKINNGLEEFERFFLDVYDSFYLVLDKKHPGLTPRDKKICAFIKLNLSTKEISSITGISTKSIENARTRIRKKLNISNTTTDLHQYLFHVDMDL